ncbi:glyoxal reductase-like [Daphnia carinata]|uniref:glyoxal reductase-like n=1 Tax=Daphnia carinata TaxID=120202 RepID=UPI00257AC600|nr:glyoxal reductase-like [Daphnia carinata]
MAVNLRNGVSMPLIGFGTFRIKGPETILKCLDAALKAGYRLIDSAVIYHNEEDIGSALGELLPKFKLQRTDLFLTSKLSPRNQGYQPCIDSVKRSLGLLKTNYLDLYLIHWPGTGGKKVDNVVNIQMRQESWKALEDCYDKGLIKAIGVSNYCLKHLEEMKSYARTFPHVLQVEHHPHYVQPELVEYCAHHNIHYQAYSSLGTTVDDNRNPLLNDEVVKEIAKNHNKSPAQILLRWATQQGIGVLPKSLDPAHVEENIALDFLLDEKEINRLNTLDTRCKYAWDPSIVI